MSEPAAPTGPDAGSATVAADRATALAAFSVLWALAGMWHLLANPSQASASTQLVLLAGIVVALAVPGSPVGLTVLALGGLATLWDEAPMTGNNWLLAGLVDVAILAAVAIGVVHRRAGGRAALAGRLLPTARLCLLCFYAFAAFAKLNTAFFDRSVSCGVVYFRESTESLGLDVLQAGGNGAVEWTVIVATAAIELSVPVLLLWRRTRAAGVVVALVFHGILALDRSHLFIDFSSVLAALFVVFLPPESFHRLAGRLARLRSRLDAEGPHVARGVHALAVAVPAGLALAVVSRAATVDALRDVGWWTWQAASVTLVVVVGREVIRHRPSPEPAALVVRPLVLAVIPALVVVNGLTPYLELKTGYGWNMYANLRTVDGDSNHLLVRATLPLTDAQEDLVRIVDSDDPGLQRYAERGFALPWDALRAYVADHPDVAVTYERAGEVVVVGRAGDHPPFEGAPPEWRRKVQPFRSSDLGSPERCQTSFLPAG